MAFDIKKWLVMSTAASRVPLKVKDKAALAEIAARIKQAIQ